MEARSHSIETNVLTLSAHSGKQAECAPSPSPHKEERTWPLFKDGMNFSISIQCPIRLDNTCYVVWIVRSCAEGPSPQTNPQPQEGLD
jgi:hypothetical protein